MRGLLVLGAVMLAGAGATAQTVPPAPPAAAAPLPDVTALLREVESNQRHMEALQRDYTYHVHTEQQELDKAGKVKKTETEDAESLTLDGVRVDRIVARNGVALSPKEQQKESERLDAAVAKAKERRAKQAGRGAETDAHGDEVLPLSCILELGSFGNPRRAKVDGRPVIVVDYAGNPQAKTHSAFEGILRDVAGTLWIDTDDRVLIRSEGHFLHDFKLGGGLLADVRQGSSFTFRATRVGDGIWLPAAIDGQGSVRVLLFAHFNGSLHVTTSEYRRFRTSSTIVSSGAIEPEGQPAAAPGKPALGSGPAANQPR